MNTIAFEEGGQQEETVSAFLMLVLAYAQEIGLFRLLDEMVHVAMKTLVYTPLAKAQTVITSVVTGCAHTKAINDTLGEEVAAANYLGLPRWPDQSQINRYLTRFTAANVDELGLVHERLACQQSRARQACGLLVVDIDQCGLVANGRTYEFHRKGYFPRKRGEEGYQLSLAYIGAYEEAVALYLDPGNVHCKSRLPDLLHAVDRFFGPAETAVTLLRRLDAGYDSAENRAVLAHLPGYVVLKGADSALARRLAAALPVQRWLPVADAVHGAEAPPDAATGLRRLVYEVHQADGTMAYALLYTNLPGAAWSVTQLFALYNERTTIEAFFCASRHVYNIRNLRSRKFTAIYAFLRFVLLTHNLLVWAKHARLAQTELAAATTRQLVGYVARVRAHVRWDGRWHVIILRSSRWAALLIEALTRPPQPIQLALPFTCLRKT
jgi:hypothetical protein